MTKWLTSVRNGEVVALAKLVVGVAAVGTIGALIGRNWFILTTQSFGSVGDWTAGAAAVAAVLAVSGQVRSARELQESTEGREDLNRCRTVSISCRLALRDLRRSLTESPEHGLQTDDNWVDWKERAELLRASLDELGPLVATSVPDYFEALELAIEEWKTTARVGSWEDPIEGLVGSSERLHLSIEGIIGSLRNSAIKPIGSGG